MIDVIIPNFNGAGLLPTCLQALRRQTRRDFVVTVADDASSDDSLRLLREEYPEVQVLALPVNRGMAHAVNRALLATTGEFVVLLNNDTEADERWIEQLIGALEREPEYAFAASKLRLFDRRELLHSAGDGYGADGVPFNRGVWERDLGQYDDDHEVWGPCGGAAAYRRSALQTLAVGEQVFDEDLFMYCEDVDLNLRAHLRGLRTVFVPTAVVYHKLSATGGGRLASYYCGRNFILVWAKNLPPAALQRHWASFVRSQLSISVDALRHIRGRSARARLRGQLAGLRALPRFVAKRRTARFSDVRTAS